MIEKKNHSLYNLPIALKFHSQIPANYDPNLRFKVKQTPDEIHDYSIAST